ncbi:hypothetical protein LOTGIDRAFT_176793, partial [Lottia gigantea]
MPSSHCQCGRLMFGDKSLCLTLILLTNLFTSSVLTMNSRSEANNLETVENQSKTDLDDKDLSTLKDQFDRERHELLSRKEILVRKHELARQCFELQLQEEQLELDTAISIATAKTSVIDLDEEPPKVSSVGTTPKTPYHFRRPTPHLQLDDVTPVQRLEYNETPLTTRSYASSKSRNLSPEHNSSS